MPDADDFDVEELRRMLRGEEGKEVRPPAVEADARPASKKKAEPKSKALGKTKAQPRGGKQKPRGR